MICAHHSLSLSIINICPEFQSINYQERIQVLKEIQYIVHHTNAKYDVELMCCIATNMIKYLNQVSTHGDDSNPRIISVIFSILVNLFQNFEKEDFAFFKMHGAELLEKCMIVYKSVREDCKDTFICNLVQLLEILSRLNAEEMKLKMANNQFLLDILNNVFGNDELDMSVHYYAVQVLKNISCYDENERSKIIEHEGLLKAFIDFYMFYNHDEPDTESISLIVLNLSLCSHTKVRLVEIECTIDMLLNLCNNENTQTRKNAVAACGNLILQEENRLTLLTHNDGSMIDAMESILRDEEDSVIQKRVARIVRHFSDETTVELMMNHGSIVETLCIVAIGNTSIEVRAETIDTLACFAFYSNETSSSEYKKILSALVKIGKTSTQPTCINNIMKSFNKISLKERHRRSMVRCQDLLHVIGSTLSSNDSSNVAIEQASNTIYNLSQDVNVREFMVTHNLLRGMIDVGLKKVSNACALSIYHVNMALVNMTKSEFTRQAMSDENDLIQCLMTFVQSSNIAIDSKEAAKSAILTLVPLI